MGDESEMGSKLDQSTAVQLTGKFMVAAIVVLFFVVVFVLFLHLYAKWFWLRNQEGDFPSASRRRRRRFNFAAGYDPPASGAAVVMRSRGLNSSVLESIAVLIYSAQDFKDELECAVCLSEFCDGEKIRLLPKCNHGFHVECIDMWFYSHSTCPLCRNPVSSSSSSSQSPSFSESTNSEMSRTDQFEDGSLATTDSGYSTETPNFPTNVLFWGNQSQVSSLDQANSSSSSSSSPHPPPPASHSLVIDIPRTMIENLSPLSPSTVGYGEEEEAKSPLTTRLRSLRRLLSREKRVIPCSPTASSIDVEQGQLQEARAG